MVRTLDHDIEDRIDETTRRVEGRAKRTADAVGDELEAGAANASAALDDAADSASSTLESVRDRAKEALHAGSEKVSELAGSGRETLEHTAHKARETYEDLVERLDQAYHDGFSEGRRALQRSADTAGTFAREHPLALCALGIAGGLLLGSLLPRSRTEDRLIGPYADEVKERAQSYGSKVVREGRKRVERAARDIQRG